MPDEMKEYKEKYVEGSDWWSRFIVLAVIALTVIFIREVLDIFRAMGSEPIALIAMVGAIVAGEFSLLYFIFRNKTDVVKETIRFERDYERGPSLFTAEPVAFDDTDYEDFDDVFPKG